jgi:hypothetical protein
MPQDWTADSEDLDHYGPALHFRGMDAHEFYPILSFAIQGSQVHDHYAVFIVFNESSQDRDKLRLSFRGKKAAKDGVVYRISKVLHCFMDLMQALWVHLYLQSHSKKTDSWLQWAMMPQPRKLSAE